ALTDTGPAALEPLERGVQAESLALLGLREGGDVVGAVLAVSGAGEEVRLAGEERPLPPPDLAAKLGLELDVLDHAISPSSLVVIARRAAATARSTPPGSSAPRAITS